jgi:7 transmembrane receptor (rhodopsin family)
MNISQLNDVSILNPGAVNDTEIRLEINRFIQNLNYWLLIVECLMVFFGICGNLLALVVINRRALRDTSSSVFITYLAIFDSCVLLVHVSSLVSSRFVRSYLLHCLLAYLTDFVTFSSVWIMVIMTIERCIAVHSPFSAKRLCTIQHARCSMYILILLDFLLCSFSFPVIYSIDRSQRKCVVREQYQTILRIVKPTLFYFIPDLILLFNLFIIYELFIARRQRAHTLINPENAVHQIDAATFNRKQLQLTVMLVTVSLSFYVFTTPAIIDYIRQRNPPTYRDVKRLKMRFLRTNLTVLWLQMSSAVSVNREISRPS